MLNRLRFVIVLIILGVVRSPCVMASGWGSVDTRLLLVFHPSMASFDYFLGKFLRRGLDLKNKPNTPTTISESWEKAQPKIKGLSRERDNLLRLRKTLIAHREATLTEIAEDEPETSGIVRDRKKETEGFERKYAKKIEEIERRMTQVEAGLEEAQEEAYAPVYLSQKETDARLQTIKGEIAGFIAQAAKERGLDVVVDQSLFKNYNSHKSEFITPSEKPPVPYFGAASAFRLFEKWEPIKVEGSVPGLDGKATSAEQHVALARKQGMFGNLQNYFNYFNYLRFDQDSLSFGPSIFIMGGEEITPMVAQKIFSSYRVASNLQKKLIEQIQNSLAYDKNLEMEK